MSDDGDSFEVVTEQSWFGRLGGSLLGALFGFILFLASFVLLYWNEGRAVAAFDALNAGARTVVSVPADRADPAHEGALVHVSGAAAVDGTPTDPVFHAAASGAIRLRRHVEMFQWHEHEESHTEKRIGGGETTHTTYTYTKVWSESAVDSTRFKQPNGHHNPSMALSSAVFDAKATRLGGFQLDSALVHEIAGFAPWTAPAAVTGGDAAPAFQRVGDRFVHGANPDAPEVGDLRVSFEVVTLQPISVVAAQVGGVLAPFRAPNGRTIALVDLGAHTAADMFHEAKAQESMLTWILRGVGFVVMVIGLWLLSAPLAWFASLLPILADMVEMVGFFLAVAVALPLTLLTIAIAWLAHRPLIGIGLIVAGLAFGYAVHRIAPRRRRTATA